MKGIIYITRNLINGMVYVGQTTRPDYKYYLGSGVYFLKALKKYGRHNFIKETLIGCETQDDLNAYEELFIELYSSLNPDIGYNVMPGTPFEGGKSISEFFRKGIPLSEEHKEKIRIANSGQTRSQESILKYVDSRKLNNKPNPRKGVSSGIKSFLGRTHTEESKKKMSEYRKGKRTTSTPVECYDPETGETLYRFDTMIEAAKSCKGDVSAVLSGKCKRAGGYHWRYSS